MRHFIQNTRSIAGFGSGQGIAIATALREAQVTQEFNFAPISIRYFKRRGGAKSGFTLARLAHERLAHAWHLATARGGDAARNLVDVGAVVLNRGEGRPAGSRTCRDCMPVGMPASVAPCFG